MVMMRFLPGMRCSGIDRFTVSTVPSAYPRPGPDFREKLPPHPAKRPGRGGSGVVADAVPSGDGGDHNMQETQPSTSVPSSASWRMRE